MSEIHQFSAATINAPADRGTPVMLYANLRQIFPESLLLECLEYKSPENAHSYLCADPVLKCRVADGKATIEKNGRRIESFDIKNGRTAIEIFDELQKSIRIEAENLQTDLIGLFGYAGYSAIPVFEDIRFKNQPPPEEKIPDLQFALYRYVFRFDHFQNQLTAIELRENAAANETESLENLLEKITFRRAPEYDFERVGAETANQTDDEFADKVRVCQKHIQRGDVFQIVPSRKFAQNYRGDEFQVYRSLRRINPSPFLFFFDYGNFSLFGSSPEAQLLIRKNTATLHPIAGTYPRGANETEDRQFAATLAADPKETAEHTMLVDLARNDLGRHCESVKVEAFKEIEFYSHVIHLVSRVTGKLKTDSSPAQILADTFPAGTLSGAPKYRAMEILNDLEPSGRSFYGGSVGFFALDGECTQAIMIRSFLARKRQLVFQAGAGVVADSVPEKETAEVKNKLAALRRAIEAAEKGDAATL